MSFSRWKMMAGVLGVSLGGLAAVSGQCQKPDANRSAGPSTEVAMRLDGPAIPAVPPVGATPAPPAPTVPTPPMPAAPPAVELPSLPPPAPTKMPDLPPPAPTEPAKKPDLPAAGPPAPPVLPAVGTTAPSPPPAPAPDLPRPATLPAVELPGTPPPPSTPPAPSPGSLPSADPLIKTVPPAAGVPPLAPPMVDSGTAAPPALTFEKTPTNPTLTPPSGVTPAAAVVPANKYRILLRVGEGEPTFEVRSGDDLLLKVACEKVDIKSPERGNGPSAVTARGKVRFVGFGAEGTCQELSFLSGTGEVSMTGAVKIQVKDKLGRVESELSTESMKYRIDPSAVNGSLKP